MLLHKRIFVMSMFSCVLWSTIHSCLIQASDDSSQASQVSYSGSYSNTTTSSAEGATYTTYGVSLDEVDDSRLMPIDQSTLWPYSELCAEGGSPWRNGYVPPSAKMVADRWHTDPRWPIRSAPESIKALSHSHHMTLVSLCLLYTSPSPRDGLLSRMPSSA